MEDIQQTLQERGKRYGEFEDHADYSQQLKAICQTSDGWERCALFQREALEMIAHKIARILNGDPDYDDSWRDIAGYAQLVVNALNKRAAPASEKLRKVYLAGPMSGLPDFNYPAFHAAAKDLQARGLEVVNPAELSSPFGIAMPWVFYMRLGLDAMLDCQAVVVLPGWEESRGASIEVDLARKLGMDVEEYEATATP